MILVEERREAEPRKDGGHCGKDHDGVEVLIKEVDHLVSPWHSCHTLKARTSRARQGDVDDLLAERHLLHTVNKTNNAGRLRTMGPNELIQGQ